MSHKQTIINSDHVGFRVPDFAILFIVHKSPFFNLDKCFSILFDMHGHIVVNCDAFSFILWCSGFWFFRIATVRLLFVIRQRIWTVRSGISALNKSVHGDSPSTV